MESPLLRIDISQSICNTADTFFRALLKVYANGNVEMLGDRPLHPLGGALPIQSYLFNQKLNVGDFQFLVSVVYNPPERTVRDLLDGAIVAAQDPGAIPKLAPGASAVLTIGPSNEENQTQREGQTFARSLYFVNTDFFGDVSFENAVFRGNVTFESCRFLGQLKLSNSRVNGTLKFDRCSFFGLPPKKTASALFVEAASGQGSAAAISPEDSFGRCADLRGALISRSLLLIRCNFSNSLLLSHIHVEGKTRLVGCRIEPQYDTGLIQGDSIPLHKSFLESGQAANAALDLRYGRFDGGLDLAAYYESPYGIFGPSSQKLTGTRATVVVGPVRGEHCIIKGGLSLSGLLTCQLNTSQRYLKF